MFVLVFEIMVRFGLILILRSGLCGYEFELRIGIMIGFGICVWISV